LIGSGRSHSKHWNMRGPFPSEGAATNIRYAPHLGHLNRSTWPMSVILPPIRNLVHFKVGAPHRINTYGARSASASVAPTKAREWSGFSPGGPVPSGRHLGVRLSRLCSRARGYPCRQFKLGHREIQLRPPDQEGRGRQLRWPYTSTSGA
jgi:hypothetical protein